MKNLILYLAILSGLILGCSKDDSPRDYSTLIDDMEGGWRLEWLGDKNQGIPDQLFRFVFEKRGDDHGLSERYWFYRDDTSDYVCVGVTRGEFTLNKNIVDVVPIAHGSQLDFDGEVISDTIVWYYPGSPEFDMFGWESGFEIEVKGDVLTYGYDEDRDGRIESHEKVDYERE